MFTERSGLAIAAGWSGILSVAPEFWLSLRSTLVLFEFMRFEFLSFGSAWGRGGFGVEEGFESFYRRVHQAGSCVCLKTRDVCERENDGVACLP